MWWQWILGVLAVWTIAGTGLAFVLGRAVRLADDRTPDTGVTAPLTTAHLPAAFVASSTSTAAPARSRRRTVPLPPVGVGLVLLVLTLETGGFLSRLTGATGTLAEVLSMDAPYSLPRLTVAAVFAVAAFAAAAGAGAQRGRRTWWVAVAVVAAAISAIKAGSTLHGEAMGAASRVIGKTGAVLVSALLAAAVVGVLFYLSRDERRDRRRILGALSAYAVAVVGLSAISAYVAGGFGSNWATAATFVEESGEALAGVAFLMAVVLGVAPQAVLPRAWALRRSADAAALSGQGSPSSRPEMPRP